MSIGTPTAVALDGRDAMLAVAMNGEPLPPVHGYPVRMVVPGLVRLRLGHQVADRARTDHVRRRSIPTGSSAAGPRWVRSRRCRGSIRPSRWRRSRPAGRPLPVSPGPSTSASSAWKCASTAGRGPRPAWPRSTRSIRGANGSTNGTRTAGNHTLEVRATDAGGQTQPETRAEPFPSGATGWHSVVVTVT